MGLCFGGFPKLGVPIMRIVAFGGLYWVYSFWAITVFGNV